MVDRGRVLVCDDDPDILTLLSFGLGERFEVTTTSSGERAIDLARSGEHDVLVVDWMMPRIDGIEVMRTLRGDARTAAMPVVMLTARQVPGSEQTSLAAGASAFVCKPFDPDVLVMLIEELLKDRMTAQARQMIQEIASRTGTAFGIGDSPAS